MSSISEYTKKLESKEVFAWFEKLCSIPHGSYNEKALSDYIYAYAKEKGLDVIQDNLHNLLIKKGATNEKLAKKDPIIIQSHIDMVLNPPEAFEKNNPINLTITDGWIHSPGTTIGADNGIGAAFSLALLDSTTIEHPPLEVLLTTQEEVGLGGAIGFDVTTLSGTTMINTDSEEEGEFFVSCCGGSTLTISLPIEKEMCKPTYTSYSLNISGLQGGHSGLEIEKERANANRFLTRILYGIKDQYDFFIQDISGGIAGNAIPAESSATLLINESDVASILNNINGFREIFNNEIQYNEKKGEQVSELSIELTKTNNTENNVLTKQSFEKLSILFTILPHGILTYDRINTIPESSVNFAMIKMQDDCVSIVTSIRSTFTTKKKFYQSQIIEMAKLLGATVSINGEYPGWAYQPNSPIRNTFIQAYKNIEGQEKNPKIVAIHAGLECGIFIEKLEALGKKIDVFSFGPNIRGAHTTSEKVEIQSVENIWKLFLEGIRLLGEKS